MTSDEPLLRFSITAVENSINHISRLSKTDYDGILDGARHHAHEFIHALREWARANEIDIRNGMET